jgi:hypothetical protein
MRITVIIPDAAVYVDGQARRVVLPPHNPTWRAIQWADGRGDVEVNVGSGFTIEDPAIVEPFLRAWRAAAPATAAPGAAATGVEEM